MDRCSQCGAKVRGGPFYTPTGASVCAGCHDLVAGIALAHLSGGGLGEAVALGRSEDGQPTGILAWVRRALGR